MSEVSGTPPSSSPTPEEIQQYKQDYSDSLKLFRNAFNDYNKPNVGAHKQAKLKEVMNEALTIMNQTACVALRDGKEKAQESKLSDDYEAFIRNPSEANRDQITADLQVLE